MGKRNYDIRSLEHGMTIVPVTIDHEVDYDGISGAGIPNPFRDNDSIQRWPLGTMIMEGGLRRWSYCKAGAVALSPGKLVQTPVPKAGHQDMVMAAAAIDATSITITPATVPVVVDEYNGGLFVVNDGAANAEGQARRVKDIPAIVHTVTGVVTLADDEGISIAVIATDTATLTRNPFFQVIVHPSPPTNRVLGAPMTLIGASNFGWLCTYGECVILMDGVCVISDQVMASNDDDGGVEAYALTEGTPNVAIEAPVGKVTQVNIDTEFGLVWLNL